MTSPADDLYWRSSTAQAWRGRKCGVTTGNQLACWDGNNFDHGADWSTTDLTVHYAPDIAGAALQPYSGLAVKEDGSVLVWSSFYGAELGDGGAYIEEPTLLAAP